MISLFIPSSVTRWLTVVVGCAILEMAQPMIAAEPSSETRTGDTLLYPKGTIGAPADPSAPQGTGSRAGTWVFATLVGVGTVGFWFWRRRGKPLAGRRGIIQIEDTRPLGNRQFLVVASCDGRRFLLGVASGGIQMLSKLDSEDELDDQNQK